MSRLTDELKAKYTGLQFKTVHVAGLGDIYFKPLTLAQAREVNQIKDDMERIGKQFQVRAKDSDGNPLVRPDELSDFMRYGDVEQIATAVNEMSKADETVEETEKKS